MHITVWDHTEDRFLDSDSGIHRVLGFTRQELVGRGWVESGLLTEQELAEGRAAMQQSGRWERWIRGHLMIAAVAATGNAFAVFS